MTGNLRGLKLRALVRDHRENSGVGHDAVDIGEPIDIGIGAVLTVGDDCWVLVEQRHERSLGIALSWMNRCGSDRVHLLVEEAAGSLARRAENFAVDVAVWEVRDRELVRAAPVGHRSEVRARDDHLAFSAAIARAGAEVVVEHGTVTGEVLGLEVCRVVDDAVSGQARLEIGVGIHDREAFALMHGETPAIESLERIAAVVRHHRRPGADPHPLNRLAPERALRHRLLETPETVGARALRATASAVPRANLRDSVPCAAAGTALDGEPLVAVFSSGIDLDVVPAAADIRTWLGLDTARLHIVVPERDVSPVTTRLAAMLRQPATVVGVELDRGANP